MKLPYEGMTSHALAHRQIHDYLLFLGATEILFQMDELYNCSVEWRFRGHEMQKFRCAKLYVDSWFRLQPWNRSDSQREQQSRAIEVSLAVANFWYTFRDDCLATLGHVLFVFDGTVKSSEKMTSALISRISSKSR